MASGSCLYILTPFAIKCYNSLYQASKKVTSRPMYHTRRATLNDTQAISALFRKGVPRWQRALPDGNVEDVPYETLTLYERWLYGGAWMSIETAALWLSHLVRGAGVPLVLEDDGVIVGYTEAFLSDEPAPFGKHLHVEQFLATAPHADALMSACLSEARAHARALHVNVAPYDEDRTTRYTAHEFTQLSQLQEYLVPAKTGQGFYQATEYTHTSYDALKGWGMPIGRMSAARHAWESLWTRLFDAVPELGAETVHRLTFTVSGQEAFVYIQAGMDSLRQAQVWCWTSKPYSVALHTAIRDWAYRQGYRELSMWANAATSAVFGDEAEATFRQHVVLYRAK